MSSEWQKVLWKKQPFPDNYVPNAFLSALRKNPNVQPYTYPTLVFGACAICQQLAVVFIFLNVFVRLQQVTLESRLLVWGSVGFVALGYATWILLGHYANVKSQPDHRKALKSSILVFLTLMALSPILRTLSAATSSDSIWALSAVLFMVNVLLADYTPINLEAQSHERLTSVLSMNAAISASVVLASRLPDDLSVFALILFAVQLFALYPILRRRLQATSAVLQVFATFILAVSSVWFTIPLSIVATALFGCVQVVVAIVAPAVLVWAQRFKNEIRGPWDVATPKVN